MLNVLFWNVGKRPIEELIIALATHAAVDVFILAENVISPRRLLKGLNSARPPYHFPDSVCERIVVFTRFSAQFLKPTFESDRISIRALKLPAQTEILLAIAHLPSKLHFDDDSQRIECNSLSERLMIEESKAGHRKTILVGDLNVNPFEKAVAGTFGLHAVMSKKVAKRAARRVQGKDYPFFYNPMWRHFGEREDGPPGTYYYERAQHTNYFWNIYDQVLVRPELMEHFPDQELRILTTIGDIPLLEDNGRPDGAVTSDHLPLFFRLDL